MTSDIDAVPAPSRSRDRDLDDWMLFPSALVSRNRRIERGLAALIWVAMPFVLYLLRTHPGGFGGLIKEPVYFLLAVVYLAAVVVVTYLALWSLTRLIPADAVIGDRPKRKTVLRAWMDAIVASFALTAILLSASTWISIEWLQDRGNRVTIDVVRWMLNLDEDSWGWHVVGYSYALFAALAIGFIVRRMARKTRAADATRAEPRQPARDPIVFAVALVAYVILTTSMALTELNFSALAG